jgi:eukaryotic-like serine/threonine-protein kinase
MSALQSAQENGGTTGPTARQDPGLPQVFGRYLLVQRLSRGGMGEIFLAKHGLAGFEKLAIIKKVLPHLAADAQFISRFVDEAQVAIKLQHVNVAQVFEVGRVADEYFLALEYVEGRDLRRTLAKLSQQKTRLPVDLALFIGRELANGLAYAHRRTSSDGASLNLVHCDISPPNVLVSFEGETKVIDFGIAKSALRGTATDPKMGFGKFGYMAPEQLIRGGVVDYRTDIYAAGVVLYELLTGQRLYEPGAEPDYRALAKKVARGEHPLPSQHDAVLAPYDQLVATALKPKLEDRYQSAAEFRDAIQQCLVAVNPTISTDQLGQYMRDMFADEMTAQRELHERVAKTHLEDFQEQFHTQTISTVSFALAQLPVQPPPAVPPALGGRVSGAQRVVAPSHELADGTGAAVLEPPEPARKPIPYLVVGALLVGTLAIVAIVLALRDPAPPAQPRVAAEPGITFEPIDEPSGSTIPAPTQPSVVPDAGPGSNLAGGSDTASPATGPNSNGSNGRHVKPEKDKPPKVIKDPGASKPALTREQVGQKFTATRQLYDQYKSQNGLRLDHEWSELNYFLQNKLTADNLDEAVRRIEGFRNKLRE